MILYKNKECTIPALCPFGYSARGGFCLTDCAWCEWHEYAPYGEKNVYYCAGCENSPQLYAKEEQ